MIERAQQKLKLDAMVVQQGRLQDQEKKLSKDELLETIRFGADKIFRSKESDISTDDIDAILDASKKRSEPYVYVTRSTKSKKINHPNPPNTQAAIILGIRIEARKQPMQLTDKAAVSPGKVNNHTCFSPAVLFSAVAALFTTFAIDPNGSRGQGCTTV